MKQQLNLPLYIFFLFILSLNTSYSQTIDWLAETTLNAGDPFVDGTIINNIAGTGLNVRINVSTVLGTPRTATDGTIVAIGANPGNASGASFTLTFLNGTASISLDNAQALRNDEDIRVSNTDVKPITVTRTSTANNKKIRVDGTTTIDNNSASQSVTGGSSVLIDTVNGGNGNNYTVGMSDITSFTWAYLTNGAFEGFVLSLSNIILPIKLTSFEASKTLNNQVLINWETASEIDNDFFTIEKSIDGVSWEILTNINSSATTTEAKSYQFIDVQPFNGTSYYRLKQTDYDGTFSYSDIESVYLDFQSQISVYPNPTSEFITIKGDEVQVNELFIFDSLQRNVSDLVTVINCSSIQCQLNVADLPKGIYFIKTKDGAIKFLKQ